MMISLSVFATLTLAVFALALAELKFGGVPVRRELGVVLVTSMAVSAFVTFLLRFYGLLP